MAQLSVGTPAPAFTLPTVDGEVSLESLCEKASAGVVIYFYPKANTPGCTTEACDFRDSLASLRGAGYEVVGISPDPVERIKSFAEDKELPFPLASDESRATIEAYGAWGIKKNYGKEYEGLIRSTIIVDTAGVVTHTFYNIKATGHVARIRRELGIDAA